MSPVPRQILEALTPDTEQTGMIFDRTGRPRGWAANTASPTSPSDSPLAMRDGLSR